MTPDFLEKAGQAGARSAIVYASGFGETGEDGIAQQNDLQKVAKKYSMPVCGPNCIGLANFKNGFGGLSATVPPSLKPGRVSAVCQSGSVGIALLNNGRGIEYHYMVTSGNEAVVTAEDYIEFFLRDEETAVVLAFIESFRNIPKLRRAAALARDCGKPIIVLKVGRSLLSQRTVASHTGALAGADKALDALFRQCGIIRVQNINEMLETASLFVDLGDRRPSGDGVGMLAVYGGEIGLLADLSDDIGLRLPPLSEETVAEVKKHLPPYSNIANPLDAWGNGDLGETYANCLAALGRDPAIDLVAVSLDIQAGTCPQQADFYKMATGSIVRTAKLLDKPVIVFSNISGGLHPGLRSDLEKGKTPILQGSVESLRAIGHLSDFSAGQKNPTALGHCQTDAKRTAKAAEKLSPSPQSESRSKEILQLYDIPVTAGKLVATVEEAQQAALEMGFPVVLKADSAHLPHKTEADVIRLDISDPEALATAYNEIMANAARAVGEDRINGVLVQEMLDLNNAVEVIAGIMIDAQCGPVILFGLGGIFTEVLTDISLRVAPLREKDAWSMVDEIKGAEILKGARGKPPVDRAAVVKILQNLSQLAMELGDQISELDINPLVVFAEGKGAVAADAFIVGNEPPSLPTRPGSS